MKDGITSGGVGRIDSLLNFGPRNGLVERIQALVVQREVSYLDNTLKEDHGIKCSSANENKAQLEETNITHVIVGQF